MTKSDKKFLKDFFKFMAMYAATLLILVGIAHGLDAASNYYIERAGQDKHCSRQSDRAAWKIDADCLYYFKSYHRQK